MHTWTFKVIAQLYYFETSQIIIMWMTGLFLKYKNQFLKSSAVLCQNPNCVTHTSGSGDIGENPAHR